MIPKVQSILYATDLSENSRFAFGYAAGLAERYGAGIVILHVLEEMSASGEAQLAIVLGEEKWSALMAAHQQEGADQIRSRLSRFCDDLQKENDACRFTVEAIVVKKGNPAQVILEEAERRNCDLVVMGTHGHGGFTDAMIGSTARRVVRRCKKPVLVVRLP